MSINVVDLSIELCARASVTPEDKGCQEVVSHLLKEQGFKCQTLQYNEVTNLWATHGQGAPFLLFLGHTDVVPAGELSFWDSPPFEPQIRNNHLYARGIADMKGCVAASTLSAIDYVKNNPNHPGTIAMLLTSDEEGPAMDGVQRVVNDFIKPQKIAVDYCVVTEPTCAEKLGDTLKIGRRGSLGATLSIRGIQGHVAYPHLAENPVFKSLNFLQALRDEHWDNGNEDFDASTLQISNLNSGVGAENVIPPDISIQFNVRYGTASTVQNIQSRVLDLLKQNGIAEKDFSLSWKNSALPYLSQRESVLVKNCIQAIENVCQKQPKVSTSGGTSDGRFIATLTHPDTQKPVEVIEFGPLNKTIHQNNECLNIDDLASLQKVYTEILGLIYK
jgi:succinyl-diaminopimelate desuccinylase